MSQESPRVSILSDHVCRLGEGPSYDAAGGRLFWLDIVNAKLLEMSWPDGETLIHDLPEMASAIAVVDEGRQLLLTETGLWIRHERDGGRLEKHCGIEEDNPATRSNDARVHPSGAFWLGTMGKKAEPEAGAIYWHFGGEVKTLYPRITIPNSICFSPDGATAYFTDTSQGLLLAVDCDPHSGLPSGEPRVFVDRRGMPGGIDGSVTDEEGDLWNVRWGAGAVDRYAPDGSLRTTIPVPARQVTCPVFVGPQADRLAVTSAWDGMDEASRRDDPRAGMTFLIDLPVKGRFEPRAAL